MGTQLETRTTGSGMEQIETGEPVTWSDDARWAVGMADSAILLMGGADRVSHANRAALMLALRIVGGDTDEGGEGGQREGAGAPGMPASAQPERLLELLPPCSWDTAAREGQWRGQVRAGPQPLLLDIRLLCHPGAGDRRLAVFSDVTGRSVREIELQQRHDELQRAHQKLAGAREQLLQAEKMASIGQLAAGVAHEINNPIGYVHSNLGTLQEYTGALLALVNAYSEALADEDPAAHRSALSAKRERLDIDFIAGDLPSLLKESREGIERVTRIVRDLKDFSHGERGVPMRPVDLQEGLESTLNIVWSDLKYKARIEKHYSPMPPVECHRSEINQVLMNLLINAGQAIDERGTIVLATGAGQGEAWISISDSGCGMPDEVIQRIFDPFFTTKPIGKGTGLGLAICYGIITKHHGRIEVSSKLGVGTTFRVVLPVTQPVAGAGASQNG